MMPTTVPRRCICLAPGNSPYNVAKLLEQAEGDVGEAIDTALKADAVRTLAGIANTDPGSVERLYRGLKKAGGKSRDVTGLERAVNRVARC